MVARQHPGEAVPLQVRLQADHLEVKRQGAEQMIEGGVIQLVRCLPQ